MFGLLLLFFTVIPITELALIISIGGKIGVAWTIIIVLGTGIAGAYLARLQGLMTIRRVQYEMAQGRVPGKEIIDAMLIFAAGLLLLTPGFLTDITGFFLLMPFGRALVRAFLHRRLAAMVQSGSVQVHFHHRDGF
jgi:UPF0716 protein FxsA